MHDISVIIRCRNEERWIGHTIQSCLDLINGPEIIIIDNDSKDQSMEIARNFAHDPSLEKNRKYTEMKFKSLDEYTPGKALNLGVSIASNNIILVISSHCVLQTFDFKEILDQLKNHCCVFGNQIPFYNGKRIQKRYIWANFKDKKEINPFSKEEGRYFMHNALSCFTKETLEVNPFDEFLQGKEDRYWAREMINKGNKILYDPNFSCDHHYTPDGNTWKGIG